MVAVNNADYKTKKYWDDRYQNDEETFDWFKKYDVLKDILNLEITNKTNRIISLGCGNSTLSEDMYDDGFRNIVNVDFSEPVIERMKLRCADRTNMSWLVMDIQNLSFDDNSFDIAIDKGTMDALMCEKGDVWDPPESIINDVKKEVDEVIRILKPGGKFIYITFGQPHFRLKHLNRDGIWDINVHKIGDAFHYFVYVATKRTEQ